MRFWNPIDKWLMPLVLVAMITGICLALELHWLVALSCLPGGFLYGRVTVAAKQDQ